MSKQPLQMVEAGMFAVPMTFLSPDAVTVCYYSKVKVKVVPYSN